jgi:hypothetical protein
MHTVRSIYFSEKEGNLLDYFEEREQQKNVPSLDELYKSAKIVFSCYGHPYAFEDALIGKYNGDPDLTVACGDPWTSPLCEESSAILSNERRKPEAKRKAKEKKGVTKGTLDNESSPVFLGDQTLAQSCWFLYNATVSRELMYATADGDIGRV